MIPHPCRVTVYGGGSWGTALAHVLACAGHKVSLLLRDAALAAGINRRHENSRYLPGLSLHQGVVARIGTEASPETAAETSADALQDADIWVLALPCQSQRQALERVRHKLGPETVIVNAAKGLELGSLKPMSQVVREALGLHRDFARRYAALSGPSFAQETVRGKPTAVVLGCGDEDQGARLREIFATPWFRSYSSPDLSGVELGGAVKNVIAIAAGVCDGLDFGHNARAALVTRGLAEITRLGTAMGARPATFMGLSGLGDLMLTCAGSLSRNRHVGLQLGRGRSMAAILADMNSVAEGVKTTSAVYELAGRLNVDMPIAVAMHRLMNGETSPMEAVTDLMSRSLKEES